MPVWLENACWCLFFGGTKWVKCSSNYAGTPRSAAHWRFCPSCTRTITWIEASVSLLISRATTEKSALYFSDSPFWFSGTMSSYCITVLWRRRRSKVHSSLIFVPFWYCIVQFFHSLRIKYGDVRETSYLFRRISIMLQRFNSVLLQLTYDYPTFWF